LVFPLIFAFIFALHVPLLHLPYFWDEAGYYVPAARDLFLSGALIPHSVPSNAHPPLVMAYLASWWKLAGYAPAVTRTAMLLLAAFSLAGVFRLAQRVANTPVAVASTLCTAIYPVFFTQSSMGQVDLAAAGLIFWGLHDYLEDWPLRAAGWFSLAALAKETAILAPLALLFWELVCPWLTSSFFLFSKRGWKRTSLLAPSVLLGAWYAYHSARTGYVFGNPEFFRYNVEATLSPVRIILAFGLRLWQVVGYQNLFVLTLATLIALRLPALRDGEKVRRRIPEAVQSVFLAVTAVYVMSMAVIGGAELARYMLPAIPLVIIVCVSTLRRRVRLWWLVVAVVVLAFAAGLFVNPPFSFALEDNLAYRDYILLHQNAERLLEARYPMARVLTAWPASDEIARPYLGYITRPMRTLRIEDFRMEQVMSAGEVRPSFDVALVFSTRYEPPHPIVENWRAWEQIRARYFGYHRDLPLAAAAQLLGGQAVYSETRNGQWIGVIEMEQVQEARANGHQK
jgi:hypothetical protein